MKRVITIIMIIGILFTFSGCDVMRDDVVSNNESQDLVIGNVSSSDGVCYSDNKTQVTCEVIIDLTDDRD